MSRISDETEAYAAYLNASKTERYERPESTEQLEQDLAKARTSMEAAWLDELFAAVSGTEPRPEDCP